MERCKDEVMRKFGIRETRYANYRVAVGLLKGQGWEQWRPTLPKLYMNKARPKALIFLRFNYLLVGSEWLKTIAPHQWHLSSYPSID